MMNQENESEAKAIRELLHPTDYTHAMDLRGEPIGDVCICGGDVFHALVAFDQGELCFYFLDGECANCGSMVTLPYPKNEDNF